MKSILILVNSNPDKSSLFKFFSDKLELIKELVWLVGSAPEELNMNQDHLDNPIILSILAAQCLSATLEDRDHSMTPLFVNFPWLLHDLGLSRGQYMGLLPRSIQYCVSQISEVASFSTMKLHWIENLLLLVASLTNISSALAALVDNGIIGSLLTIIQLPDRRDLSLEVTYIASLSLEILDLALNNHTTTLSVFHESHGVDAIVTRFSNDITYFVQNPSCRSQPLKLLLQNAALILSTYIQEARNDSNARDIELYRNNCFLDSLERVFINGDLFTSSLVTTVLSVLADIINKDPSPPTILNSLLSSPAVKRTLELAPKLQSIENDLLIALVGVISAISLINDGRKMVLDSDVIPQILNLFEKDLNYFPHSKSLMVDQPSHLGSSLEQLGRHYPDYLPCIFSTISQKLLGLFSNARKYLDGSDGLNSFDDNYAHIINVVSAFANTLEQLLERKNSVEEFVKFGGVRILFQLKQISFGPLKFFLISAATTITASNPNFGYSPLHASIRRIGEKIILHSPKELIQEITLIANEAIEKIAPAFEAHLRQTPYLLDGVTNEPLSENIDVPSSSDTLIASVKELAKLTFCVELLGQASAPKNVRGLGSALMDELKASPIHLLMKRIVEEVYIITQKETSQFAADLMIQTQEKRYLQVRQPLFILRVVTEGAVVRDSFEDTGKRLYKLPKGAQLVSVERKISANSGSARYKLIDGGWISRVRNISSNEPQIVVVDVHSTRTDSDCVYYDTPDIVSARRACFTAMTSFNQTVKTVLFTALPKVLFSKDESSVSSRFHWKLLPSIIPLAISTIKLLLPPLTESCITPYSLKDFPVCDRSSDQELISADRIRFIEDKYLVQQKPPNINEFSLQDLLASYKSIELCQSLLFDAKKSFFQRGQYPDYCNLMLIHIFSQKDLLNALLHRVVLLLYCTIDPFQGSSLNQVRSHYFSDAYPLHYHAISDEDLEKNNSESSANDQHLFQEYRRLRQLYLERRKFASQYAPRVIEFLRQVIVTLGNPPSSFEKNLHKISNDSHNYNPEAFKRSSFAVVLRQILPLWFNEYVTAFPPFLIQALLELLTLTIKCTKDVKTFESKSALLEESGIFDSLLSGSRSGNRMNRAPLIARQTAFRVSDETLNTLVDMGFERSDGLAVAQALRSNDVSQLVPLLLENPGFIATTRLHMESLPNEERNDERSEEAPVPIRPGVSSEDAANDNGSSNPDILPPMILSGDDQLSAEVDFIGSLYIYLMKHASSVFLRHIEIGPSKANEKAVDANSGANSTREVFTVSVLNLLLKLFEGFNLSEENFRLYQLIWLYERANLIMREFSSEYHPWDRQTGILHSIVLIISSKISAANLKAGGNEVLLLYLRKDPRFTTLHTALAQILPDACAAAIANQDGALSWLAVTFLLFDILQQNVVLDSEQVVSSFREIENIHKYNPGRTLELKAFGLSAEEVVSPTLKDFIDSQFLSKKLKLTSSHEFSGIEEDSKNRLVSLPMLMSGLNAQTKLLCAESCCIVLGNLSCVEVDKTKIVNVVHSILQCIIRLQEDEEIRCFLQKKEIHKLVLGRIPTFDGARQLVVTILQRQLEDEQYLRQSMRTAIKITFDRIMKEAKMVSLNSLIEYAAPLLYRNQFLFLDILVSDFSVTTESNQLLLSLKNMKESNRALGKEESINHNHFDNELEDNPRSSKRSKISEKDWITTKKSIDDGAPLHRKRIAHNDSSLPAARMLRFESIHEIAQDVFLKLEEKMGTATPSSLHVSSDDFSAAELLLIIADLIALVPSFVPLVTKITFSGASLVNMTCLQLLFNFLHNTTDVFELKEGDERLKLYGVNLMDSIAYFFAALLSRPGEGKTLVMKEIESRLHLVLNSLDTEDFSKSFLRTLEIVYMMLQPPAVWLQRDIFLVPVKEIHTSFIQQGLFELLVDIFDRAVNLDKNLLLDPLAKMIDCILKKSGQTLKVPENLTNSPGDIMDVSFSQPHYHENLVYPIDRETADNAAGVVDHNNSENETDSQEEDDNDENSEEDLSIADENDEDVEEDDEDDDEEIIGDLEHERESDDNEQEDDEPENDDDTREHEEQHSEEDDEIMDGDDQLEMFDERHPPNLSMEESRAQSRDDAESDHESRMDQSNEDQEEEEENESNDEGVVEGEDAPGEDDEDYPEEDREDMMQEYEHEDIIHEDQPLLESEDSSEPSNGVEDLNHHVYLTPSRGMRRSHHNNHRSRGISLHPSEGETVVYPFNDGLSSDHVLGVLEGSEFRLRVGRNSLSSILGSDIANAHLELNPEGTVYQLPFGMGAVEFSSFSNGVRPVGASEFNITISRNEANQPLMNGPRAHSLLSVLENRRGRMSLPTFPSFLTSSRGDAHYVLPSQNRPNRGFSHKKRKVLGPLVSERRWGVDLGLLEGSFSRVPSLIRATDKCLKDSLNLQELAKDDAAPVKMKESAKFPNSLGLGMMRLMANTFFGGSMNYEIHEESKEEGPLQETKEDLPELPQVESITSSTPHVDNSGSSSTNPIPAVDAEVVPSTADVQISQENVDFLESLPFELRQEVLLAAEEPFLQSLPPRFREEARLLREQRALELELFNSFSNNRASQSVPPSIEAAPPIVDLEPPEAVEARSETVIAPVIPLIMEKKKDPFLWTEVGLTESRSCPFTQHFVDALLTWFKKSPDTKVPNALLRLLSSVLHFDEVRYNVLKSLFEINLLSVRAASHRFERAHNEDNHRDICSFSIAKSLFILHYLIKKTQGVVWYEVMSDKGNHLVLFRSLICFIVGIQEHSEIDFESGLAILEKFCMPYSKLSAEQVNDMMRASNMSSDGSSMNEEKKSSDPKKKKKILPYPRLEEEETKLLCSIPKSLDCTNTTKKSLIRVMRYLSLLDENWEILLTQLAVSASDLMAKTQNEISQLHDSLISAVQSEQSREAISLRMEICCPKIMWEVRLLTTLRLMTVLRSRSGPKAQEESEVVSRHMKHVRSGRLWELLSECLDIVREIEGVEEITFSEDAKPLDLIGAKSGNRIISSLTMRFIPLIECFLTFFSKTVLIKPTDSGSKGTSGNSLIESSELVRSNSLLPGSRFRQNTSYLQMQLEAIDESSGTILQKFVGKNAYLLNMILRHNVNLLESSFSPLISVPKCRMYLHFDIKRAYFNSRLKKLRQTASRAHGSLRIAVRRSHVFEESFQSLRHKTAEEMRRRLNVTFLQEEGVDASGLTREWFTVLAREIFNPNYALFSSTGDGVTFQPNAHSYINPDHLSYFKFVGRVIGKAICDGHLLDVHFTRSFYKHILGLSVNVNDLEPIEPDYYKSLIQILETPLDYLGLELAFSAETNEFGKISIVDLIPGGQEIPVTEDNKHEYVRLIAYHRMTSAIKKQIDAFLEGFHDLVPPELISIFDANELELLISGLPDIDVDDLRANTDYHGYQPNDPSIGHFWSIIKSLSQEDKAQFIQFVTGSSKVPLEGFKALQGADGIKRFNIHKSFGSDQTLPTAHTCFNQLDLPEYSSEEVMRDKLLLAIKEGSEGFGFA
eukprot:CAMPEP_0173167414 /NCGR_PEP_ID=MMETSP1105-20130129/22646_1 /TAXON_ID=2985 /ORGANISM="Ochromonas sp., Strain BG-1" /LENGTH=3503 /DNA_ID=CAMNT_0014088945 /DNA_START=675 /DNA_END=11186 /DNA_ORIENTATION=+